MHYLFIDRIALVYSPSSSEEYSLFWNYLWGFQGEPQHKFVTTTHETHVSVKLANSRLVLQLGYSHHKSYFKVEFKPHEMAVEDWEALHDNLDNIFESGYQTLLEKGRVSCIEIATDIPGITPAGLFPFDTRSTNSLRYPLPPAPPDSPAPWETVYLGHRTSGRSTKVYDKVKQLKTKGIKKKGLLTRIEARRRRTKLRVDELMKLPNPFLSVGICHMSVVQSASTAPHWQEFLANALQHGPQLALGMAGKRRKQYKTRLKQLQCDWWHPTTLWKSFPAALDVLLHPPAESAVNGMGQIVLAAA